MPSSNWHPDNAQKTSEEEVQSQPNKYSYADPVANPNLKTPVTTSRSSSPDTRNSSNIQVNQSFRANVNTNAQTKLNVNKANTAQPQTPPTPSAPITTTTATNKNAKDIDNPSKQVSAKTDTQDYKLDELLSALNKLSHFTTQYLGKVVVTNYWK